MIHLPFNLCITFQCIIGYFFVFISYSFYEKVKLFFLLDTTFFKRVPKFFICLEMPVKITQYRGSVGIFNNRNLAFRSKFTNFTQTLQVTRVGVPINFVFQIISSHISNEFSIILCFCNCSSFT